MRFISTRTHGIMDYLYGVLILASPWLFNFNRGGAETAVPVVIGIAILVVSIMTDYEYALVRVIPMNIHLMLDIAVGLFLAVSPWLFDFDEYVFIPHVVFGLIAIGAGLMTVQSPAKRTAHHQEAKSRI